MYSKQRNAGQMNKLALFNRINKHRFGGLGKDSTPFVYISRIFCTLTCAKE
jgi:hypothetical protein